MPNHVGEVVESRSAEFVQLLTGIQSNLYSYICSLIVDTSGAFDVLQETNVVLWDKADEYDPGRPFRPWAYQIAYLQVLAYRKRCVRSRLVFDESLVSEMAEEFLLETRTMAVGWRPWPSAWTSCPNSEAGAARPPIPPWRVGRADRQRVRKAPNVVSASLYRVRKALLDVHRDQAGDRVSEQRDNAMIDPDDPIATLIDAVIDGRCDEKRLREFESLMRDPRIRSAYLDQMRMHALLQWRHGRTGTHADVSESRPAPPVRRMAGRDRHRGGVLVGVGVAVLSHRTA